MTAPEELIDDAACAPLKGQGLKTEFGQAALGEGLEAQVLLNELAGAAGQRTVARRRRRAGAVLEAIRMHWHIQVQPLAHKFFHPALAVAQEKLLRILLPL